MNDSGGSKGKRDQSIAALSEKMPGTALGKTPDSRENAGPLREGRNDEILIRKGGDFMRHQITPAAAVWNAHQISSGNRRADGPRIVAEPCCAGPEPPSRCGCADGSGAACGRRDHPHEGHWRGTPCVLPWPRHCGIGPEWHPLGVALPRIALLLRVRLQTSLLRISRLRNALLRNALLRNAPWSRSPGAP